METQTNSGSTNIFERNRTLIKGVLTGFLTLCMLIPIAYIFNLVDERESRQKEVVAEISSKWATAQKIAGPVLMIPYKIPAINNKGDGTHYIYLLPDKLNVTCKLLPEVRHRSLYQVILYRSQMDVSGHFNSGQIAKAGISKEQIIWNEARLVMGLDDSRGLEDEVVLTWDKNQKSLEAGVPNNKVIQNGLSNSVTFYPDSSIEFRIHINLKGSDYLHFVPVGKTTEVTITSPWTNPSFDGNYLPMETADITDSGFTAKWKILEVSRSYPSVWKDDTKYEIYKSAFGVKLIQPSDGYTKTNRSLKYAILIIALTFTVFFFIELFQKKQIHPLQYVLVGIALCVFYTLLLSISEYTGFNTAYTIAASATIALITLYVWSIFNKFRIATGFLLALSALYTYIFILIQLQDYALLCGSIGLFLIVATIMFYSRKIDWYHPGSIN